MTREDDREKDAAKIPDSDAISYDAISAGYNELHGAEQATKAAILAGHLRVLRTDKVIDVGCGTGLGAHVIAG